MAYEMCGWVKGRNAEKYGKDASKEQCVLWIDDGNAQFPNTYKVLFRGKALESASKASVGARVKIAFAINGRVWMAADGRRVAFTDLIGISVEALDGANQPAQPVPPPAQAPVPVADPVVTDKDIDTLPF